jgi:hypothetical protein
MTDSELNSYLYRLGLLAEAAWGVGLHEHAVLALKQLLERYGIDTDITDEIPAVQEPELVRPYVRGRRTRLTEL